MTSQSSGYFRMNGNYCLHGDNIEKKRIIVPDGHVVMLSLREYPLMCCAKMALYYRENDGSDSLDQYDNFLRDYDTATLYKTKRVTVELHPTRTLWHCLHLFFTLHIDSAIPEKLPSGLFNCSVDHYSSFQHHLQCNLVTECDDGRDETEHCAYSSPECQGLVALCNRCYKFISKSALRAFDTDESHSYRKSSIYCKSIGGLLGMPKCDVKWYHTLSELTLPYLYLQQQTVIVGLYIGTPELPPMYRKCVVGEHKTVLHHSLPFNKWGGNDKDAYQCITSRGAYYFKWAYRRSFSRRVKVTLCEFTNNKQSVISTQQKTLQLSDSQSTFNGRQSLTVCAEGHLTLIILTCDSSMKTSMCHKEYSPCAFSNHLSFTQGMLGSQNRHFRLVPLFSCSNDATKLSYTLVCDFVHDCLDNSDESFCIHPPCEKAFTCANSQCVPFDNVYDQVPHCLDESDEKGMTGRKLQYKSMAIFVPPPVLIKFDGAKYFVPTAMNSSEFCPETHYRCPDKFNNCLPVYTLCNGVFDCTDHEDERACEKTCAGFFRCRASRVCLHGDHLCDGWPHCPLRDDELSCDVTCPDGCLCHGQTFLCGQPFYADLFPDLRYLDATGSGMTLSDVSNNSYLIHLILAQCSLFALLDIPLVNLHLLDISGNQLKNVTMAHIVSLKNLKTLSLSNNPMTLIYADFSAITQQKKLTTLDLSNTLLTVFDSKVLSKFVSMKKLNITSTTVHTISNHDFRFTPRLAELYLDGSPVKTFSPNIFKDLYNIRIISTDNYRLCCNELLPDNFDKTFCFSPKDEISSCEDLLQSGIYRVFLWMISCLSLSGNAFCFVTRLCVKKMASASGFSVFVMNLTMADFLMGVYIAIIGAADEIFQGKYLHYDDVWTSSATCKLAGFLSVLSCEVSAMTIWFITLDRFVVLRFPFSTLRFGKSSAAMACLLMWATGFLLALVPLLPVTSSWEFYGQTGICIPLPVTRQEFKGKTYSFVIFILLNFVLLLMISLGQGLIFLSIKQNALTTNTTKVSRDMTIARRLITVAITDFLCWFPIGLCGVLALAGVPIPVEVNVALAIFVLPLNSALNPFLYTFNTLAEKRRKSTEDKLLKWLESHASIVNS